MDTLVIVAHGSPRAPRANRPVFEHARRVRDLIDHPDVRVAFVKGSPGVETVVERLAAGRTIVVPLFASAGYITTTLLPREIETARQRGTTVHLTPPVGTHDGLSAVVRDRAGSAVHNSANGVGLALVGHGSTRTPANAAVVERHAARIRETGVFGQVEAFFLEEEPPVEAVFDVVAAVEIVVVPFFMVNGHHVQSDVPGRLGLAMGVPGTSTTASGRLVRYTGPVGTHRAITQIILGRWTSAVNATP